MGSSSYKKNEIKSEEKKGRIKKEMENLKLLNSIVEISQTHLFEEQKRKEEEEQKKKRKKKN